MGVDVYGSVLKKYHETGEFDESEIYPYITEGVGEDIIPKNVDFSIIDYFEKVNDKEGALMARRLAREEGLLMGYSAGTAIAGLLKMKDRFKAEDVVVVVFHDHGSRYVGKIYNDEWMRERGFLEDKISARMILASQGETVLQTIDANSSLEDALKKMRSLDLSQLPVISEDRIVGTLLEDQLVDLALGTANVTLASPVSSLMSKPLPRVGIDANIHEISRLINRSCPAVLIEESPGKLRIITQYDIVQQL
jgi:cystathionine beta-synthase